MPHLSGDAHFLLPGQNGAASVAVRVYESSSINKFDEEYMKRQRDQGKTEFDPFALMEKDVDGLCDFRDTFKSPVVFFVLPLGSMQEEQLGNMESFTMRAQMILSSTNSSKSNSDVGSLVSKQVNQ